MAVCKDEIGDKGAPRWTRAYAARTLNYFKFTFSQKVYVNKHISVCIYLIIFCHNMPNCDLCIRDRYYYYCYFVT